MLFDTLGIKQYPITCKSEKAKWRELKDLLTKTRNEKAIDVLDSINQMNLILIAPKVDGYYGLYTDAPKTVYISDIFIREFLDLNYSQFLVAINFLYPEAMFSTEHGAKGEEYDNVMFVISKGWNQYQFETYAPMIMKKSIIHKGKEASFERNRNLFYVCCSRPKKRLELFVSVPIEPSFKSF